MLENTENGTVQHRPRRCVDLGMACVGGRFCTQCGHKIKEDNVETDHTETPVSKPRPSPVQEAPVERPPSSPPEPSVPKSPEAPSPKPQQHNTLNRYVIACRRSGKPDLQVSFDRQELTAGQSPDCDIILAGDPYASRTHARISQSDGKVIVEDMGSSNGTFVRVKGPMALDPGDEFLIGTTVLRIQKVDP